MKLYYGIFSSYVIISIHYNLAEKRVTEIYILIHFNLSRSSIHQPLLIKKHCTLESKLVIILITRFKPYNKSIEIYLFYRTALASKSSTPE